MKKYLYNLCVCVFGMAFVFQADEAFGMNNSRNRTKLQSTSQKSKAYNSSQKSTQNYGRTSNKKFVDEEFEEEEEEDNDDNNRDERRSKKKKPTLSELKECPCVQEYIKLTKEEDDEDESTKKKLKNRSSRNTEKEDEEDEEMEYSKKNKSSKNSNRPQYSSKKNEDESWKHEVVKKRADASYSFEKYKMIPLFNKQYAIPGINLAENSVPSGESLSKNINGNNEDKSLKDLNSNQKPKYRIDQKESVKFRQELEKYRQIYA